MHMVLDTTKTAMERCIEAIEANNAKYLTLSPRQEPIYTSDHLWHDSNHEQRYRDMKERIDAWDY